MDDKLKLLFVIVERSRADKATAALSKAGVSYEHSVFAIGAAGGIMEVIGVDSEKSLIIGTVLASRLGDVKRVLESDVGFGKERMGIAFTVPLSAVGGPASYKILTGDVSTEPKNEEKKKLRK